METFKLVIGLVVACVVLYFIIKNAIKNGMTEFYNDNFRKKSDENKEFVKLIKETSDDEEFASFVEKTLKEDESSKNNKKIINIKYEK